MNITNEPCSSDARTADNAYLSAIIIGVIRFLSSLILSQLLLRHRRRQMYFISASFTMVSLLSFATCGLLLEHDILIQGGVHDSLQTKLYHFDVYYFTRTHIFTHF